MMKANTSSGRPGSPQRNNGRAKGRYKPAGARPQGRNHRQPAGKGKGKGPSSNPRSEDVSPSRLEAAKALYSLEKGAKVADVLEAPRRLKPEDEALLRELVYGCTRQKRLLDYHLKSLCQSPFEKLPVEAQISLRLGLYQLLFLDRIPPHAAVHESVNLVKKGGQEKFSGFVNAVLRNAETKKESFLVQGENDADTLAIRYSHPTWIAKRWVQQFGPEKSEAILKADNQPHPVYLHVKPEAGEKVKEELGRQNIRVESSDWPSRCLRVASHEGGLFSGESFRQGDWIVQDWVPQAMLDLLPLSEGQRVWDVCAAPGGKTIALAWKLGEKGQVLATDASPARVQRLSENLKRVGLKQTMVSEGGVRKLPPSQKFDLAWVDAPCSGTGVLSRRADLRWKISPDNILEHISQQRELLEEAQGHLYPRGYLVYSTCSLEKEENQDVVKDFLKSHSNWKAMVPEPKGNHPEVLKDEWGLSFLPTPEHDGGFLSVLQQY